MKDAVTTSFCLNVAPLAGVVIVIVGAVCRAVWAMASPAAPHPSNTDRTPFHGLIMNNPLKIDELPGPVAYFVEGEPGLVNLRHSKADGSASRGPADSRPAPERAPYG